MKQGKMIMSLALLGALLLLIALSVKIGAILTEQNTRQQPEKIHVVILSTNSIDDQSWGSLAYKSKLMIEEEFPVQAQLIADIQPESRIMEETEQAVSAGADLVIGHGREFTESFAQAAEKYPSVQFANLHARHTTSRNHTIYLYEYLKTERVAALAAAMKTTSGKVGLIDAQPDREVLNGFETGLREQAPHVSFYYESIGSWDDEQAALAAARRMKAAGVDVIYARGNKFNRAIIDYAQDHNLYVIGFLEDQAYIGKDVVLTSVINDITKVYRAMLRDYMSEDGMPSGQVYLTGKDGVYSLAPPGPMFSPEQQKRIAKELKQIGQ